MYGIMVIVGFEGNAGTHKGRGGIQIISPEHQILDELL
jgi:hypothetical protein